MSSQHEGKDDVDNANEDIVECNEDDNCTNTGLFISEVLNNDNGVAQSCTRRFDPYFDTQNIDYDLGSIDNAPIPSLSDGLQENEVDHNYAKRQEESALDEEFIPQQNNSSVFLRRLLESQIVGDPINYERCYERIHNTLFEDIDNNSDVDIINADSLDTDEFIESVGTDNNNNVTESVDFPTEKVHISFGTDTCLQVDMEVADAYYVPEATTNMDMSIDHLVVDLTPTHDTAIETRAILIGDPDFQHQQVISDNVDQVLIKSFQAAFALVTKTTNDVQKYELFLMDRTTGILSNEPLDLPDWIVNNVLNIMRG